MGRRGLQLRLILNASNSGISWFPGAGIHVPNEVGKPKVTGDHRAVRRGLGRCLGSLRGLLAGE